MKPESFKFGTAVQVQWVDSTGRRGWSHPPTDGPYKPEKIQSNGFVVAADDDALTISSSVNESNCVVAPLAIPWGCITGVEVMPEHFHLK